MAEDLLHDCPGGCGRQIARNMLACQDCRLTPPGGIRARVEAATPYRHANPAEYSEAVADLFAWYRTNPPVRES